VTVGKKIPEKEGESRGTLERSRREFRVSPEYIHSSARVFVGGGGGVFAVLPGIVWGGIGKLRRH